MSMPEDTPAVAPAPLPPSPNPPPNPPQHPKSPKGMTPLTTPSQPHPFSALLTPYSSSPLYPPSPPSPPPPPLSTLRCLLLSSSLPPPPASLHPLLPQTPYTPPPSLASSQREENVARSRAICFRRTELTKEEWGRERTGVEKWLKWVEGREIVLVSGGESVRNWVLDGGVAGDVKDIDVPVVEVQQQKEKPADNPDDEFLRLAQQLRDKVGYPDLGTWARGEDNLTHRIPLHPPLHAILSANVRIFTTIHSMYTRYLNSFTNGTQTEAVKFVWDRSPEAFSFLVKSCKSAWVNAPDNFMAVKKFYRAMENEVESEKGGGPSSGEDGAGPGGKSGR